FLVTLDRAQTGICLLPHAKVRPLATIVKLVDKSEEAVVFDNAVEYVAGVLINRVIDALPHEAGRRDHIEKWLLTSAHRLLNDVVEVAVLDGVQLVDDRVMHV